MQDIRTYRIKVQGQVDGRDLNATGPIQMTVARAGTTATLLTVSTDQSGLVGLIRHLHGRGFVLLSITRER